MGEMGNMRETGAIFNLSISVVTPPLTHHSYLFT